MGEQLLKEYEKAKKLGGLVAQMRLAMLTNMPGPKAAEAPDSPENLAKFATAMEKLERETNP